VNNPAFGSGLQRMVFLPAADAIAATAQVVVQSALQQWLGDLIHLQTVQVIVEDSTVQVTVRYVVVRTQQQQVAQFTGGT